MPSFFKYAFLIFVAALLASCSHVIYHSLWQSPPMKADGIANEWENPLKLYDSGNNVHFSVNNDLDNLYLRIKTNDLHTQMRILESGVQFWIDTAGKYKEMIGLEFPIKFRPKKKAESSYRENNDSVGQRQFQRQRQATDFASLKNRYLKEEKLSHLSGFKPPIGGVVPVPNDFGIAICIGWDSSNTMLYEVSVPFATFFRTKLAASDSAKVFGLSIAINGFQSEPGPGRGPMSGGFGGGFGMGMGGFGMGMGGMGMAGMGFGMRIPLGGGGANPGNSGSTYGNAIKLKIKLAVQP